MPDPTPTPNPTPGPLDGDAIARLVQRLGGGDANQAIAELVRENRDYRERHRQDQEVIGQLQKQIPAQGAVVLTGDDATQYTALKALNLKPEEITAAVTERDQLRGFKADTEREKTDAEAAGLLGWKPSVLSRLRKSEGMHIELKDVDVPDPKDSTKLTRERKAFARPAADEKAELKPLDQHVQQHLADFLPALKETAPSGGTQPAPVSTGPRIPQQPAGGKAPTGDVVGEFTERSNKARAERPNPLFPAAGKAAS